MPDRILKIVWLEELLSNGQQILASQAYLSLVESVQLADKTHEIADFKTAGRINEAAKYESYKSEIEAIGVQHGELWKELRRLTTGERPRSLNRNQRAKIRQFSSRPRNNGLCWFHYLVVLGGTGTGHVNAMSGNKKHHHQQRQPMTPSPASFRLRHKV